MNTVEKLQNDLTEWYENSAVYQFMNWWASGLKSFVPDNYQEKLFPQPIKIFITRDEQDIVVWNQYNKELERIGSSEESEEQWWHQVQHIINQADGKKVSTHFLLSNKDALVRKIALPQAAKENLLDVIGFELDKYVPFNKDQVQLGYKIDRTNTTDDKLLLDLAVIPKQKVMDVLKLCDEKSIFLDSIDVNLEEENSKPAALGVNLLPADKRKPKDFTNLKINVVLTVVLVALVYFVMYTSLANKQNKIDKLTVINEQLQKQARTSKLLNKELKNAIVSSKFLQNKKQEHPAIMEIFSEVTSMLPDNTYLTRFKLDHNKLEITGQSANANSLIPLLNESKNWYVPQFIGAVVPDPRTNKEKFTIKAELNEPQPEEQDGNNS